MDQVNETIRALKINDKVFLDDGLNSYEGFVSFVNEDSITINIFVPDVDLTFQRNEIVEITII